MDKCTAFVLGGGGSRGALQVGGDMEVCYATPLIPGHIREKNGKYEYELE